ncbi:c-type cytochrome [Polynucleobacter aenigmaticus]|uniref:c-type cytochrome n=1 Tax=Polynucleobacter aenigmaticus TaxID=1743164 RepID=UPI001F0B453D|nr:hypothetical protein [Polynucleobacter aenigmaticus]
MKFFLLITLLSLCPLSVKASIDDAKAAALAKQNACLGCHAIDKKIVGPSLQAIAKKICKRSQCISVFKKQNFERWIGIMGCCPHASKR